MNSKYSSSLKKLLLTTPTNRKLYLSKRKIRIKNILKNLNLDKNQIPTIHVVGTKGKGSTAAIMSSILKESNYTTGLFTSPHLTKVTERIRINFKPITQNDFCITNARQKFRRPCILRSLRRCIRDVVTIQVHIKQALAAR